MTSRSAPHVLDKEETEGPAGAGGPWVVILYNCDCHTFDEVIAQLCLATRCGVRRALQVALEAHTRGRAIAFTGDEETCERVAGVLRAIRLQVETDRA